jgi:hypothetical protein
MNATFKSMSDLVADAEDLIARVAHSQTPQVRALANTVQISVNRLKEQLRKRARGLRPRQGSARSSLENPWLYAAAGASMAIGIAAWVRLQRKKKATMTKSSSFDRPMESDWHRMISEAAYFLAENRGFESGRALDDWLEAERKVKEDLAGGQNEF